MIFFAWSKKILFAGVVFSCIVGIFGLVDAAATGAAASGNLATITSDLNQAYQSLGGASDSSASNSQGSQGAFPLMESAISKFQKKLNDVKFNVNNMIATAENLKSVYDTGTAQYASQNAQSFLPEIQGDWGYVKSDWSKIKSNWNNSCKGINASLGSVKTNLDSANNLFVPVGADVGSINRAIAALKNQSSDAFAGPSRQALEKSRGDIAARRDSLLTRQSKYNCAVDSLKKVENAIADIVKGGYQTTNGGVLSGRIQGECLQTPQPSKEASSQLRTCIDDLKSYKKGVAKIIKNLNTLENDLAQSRNINLPQPSSN